MSTIYAIRPDGKLEWYRHLGSLEGAVEWSNNGRGIEVGTGWGHFKAVFSSGNGIIYAIRPDGKLEWYRHNGFIDGQGGWWNNGQGIEVGTGWGYFKAVLR